MYEAFDGVFGKVAEKSVGDLVRARSSVTSEGLDCCMEFCICDRGVKLRVRGAHVVGGASGVRGGGWYV